MVESYRIVTLDAGLSCEVKQIGVSTGTCYTMKTNNYFFMYLIFRIITNTWNNIQEEVTFFLICKHHPLVSEVIVMSSFDDLPSKLPSEWIKVEPSWFVTLNNKKGD